MLKKQNRPPPAVAKMANAPTRAAAQVSLIAALKINWLSD